MTKLNHDETTVLEALRANVEGDRQVRADGSVWRQVYLDNASADLVINRSAFAGYLSALQRKGFYVSQEDGFFGDVRIADETEPKGTPGPFQYRDGEITSASGSVVAFLPECDTSGDEVADREAVEAMNADGELLAASWELLDVLCRLVGGNGREGDLFDREASAAARRLIERLGKV